MTNPGCGANKSPPHGVKLWKHHPSIILHQRAHSDQLMKKAFGKRVNFSAIFEMGISPDKIEKGNKISEGLMESNKL